MTTNKLKPIAVDELPSLFGKIDGVLANQKNQVRVVILGGMAVIASGFRQRATLDIDIARTPDTETFVKACEQLGIPVDVVTVASTVDFQTAPTRTIFLGKHLVVDAITAPDLIKLKLERFAKQDPDDIYAIIEKTKMSYDDFKKLFLDMLPDFVGNPRGLILSGEIVVERLFADRLQDFCSSVGK